MINNESSEEYENRLGNSYWYHLIFGVISIEMHAAEYSEQEIFQLSGI
jgi:hypothetical protein